MSDEFDEYIVKFRYKSEYKIVYIKRDELDVDYLINHGEYWFLFRKSTSIVCLNINMLLNMFSSRIIFKTICISRNEVYQFDSFQQWNITPKLVRITQCLIFPAFNSFKIAVTGKVSVQLRDNMNIYIPRSKVLQHIKAYWRNDSFYFDLSYTGDPNSCVVDVITPTMFEDYMKQINQRELLTDCNGQQEKDVASRQKLIQIAVDYLTVNYGTSVDTFHRQMMANVLVKLFPFLGIKDGSNIGTVSFDNWYGKI